MKRILLFFLIVMEVVIPLDCFCSISMETFDDNTLNSNRVVNIENGPVNGIVQESSKTKGQYQMVWHDEFNGNYIDTTAWNFEHGFLFNNEDQYYQNINAFCKNGELIIEARRTHILNPCYDPDNPSNQTIRKYIDYTSARMNTKNKRNFLYGKFEMRAKIPVKGGAWPAFWTLGKDLEWPACGEIDIMEYYRDQVLANVAWDQNIPLEPIWKSKKYPLKHFIDRDSDWVNKFHIWCMDWDNTSIRLYLDGELLNEVPLAITVNGELGKNINPFQHPQYIILNLAIGGDSGGKIDDTAFPMQFVVDYVRVYQK
jgi:beta-glucanase (GH16 family)